ncbi:alpha/beta hydrolase [Spiroplasma endosymbiont of Tricholauxania praeusta]|uniref:alpha/beta hydrolase n=1 Tax=Spiroplasma endosymbiont of Tricholauxania praeusta TaxID=3066296 RepID=UPI0030CC2764
MTVINTSVNQKILLTGYKKFCYSFSKILLVILLFPFVYFYSKKYQKQFLEFCFSYQKEGKFKINNEQTVDINSFNYHQYDCQIKNLNKYGYPIDWKKENYQEFTIKNDNNQNISCLTVIQKKKSDKWVIGFHGWTENKYLALRLVSWFYEEGYNILTFDSVAHGKTDGQYSDIGLTCAENINCLINWIKDNYQVSSIGLIGNSMGTSTINYYLFNYKVTNLINWAITDCGFSNLLVQFRYVMQYRYKKPWWLISNGLTKRYQKFTNTNILEYDLLKKSKTGFQVPTLLIHGKKDNFVPFFMANVIHNYQVKLHYKNYDYLFLENIGHIETLPNAYQTYINKIKSFINTYEIKK